jgi:MFS family permease
LLVGVSIYIRLKMSESPLFAALQKEGKTSVNPLKESFGHKTNFKMVLLALFGAVMGQGVIWYTGQFYAQSFLENAVKIEFMQNREILLWAIGLATPFFLVFGWLSDKVGRKWIMLTGMLLGVVFYRPIFQTFLKTTNSASWQRDGLRMANSKVNSKLIKTDTIEHARYGPSIVQHSKTDWELNDGRKFSVLTADTASMNQYIPTVIMDTKPVYLDKILTAPLKWKFIALVWVMIVFVTMAYGPIAAFLVELFPTKIRYTSMSLPYHIGNGVFGGLVPFIATLLATTFTKDPLVGLWYPIGVAGLCFIIGALYLTNKVDNDVND